MSLLADQLYEPAASPGGPLHVHSGHWAPCSVCVGTPCPSVEESLTAAMSPPAGQEEKKQHLTKLCSILKWNMKAKRVCVCVCVCVWSTSLLRVSLSLVCAVWVRSRVSNLLFSSFTSASKSSRSLYTTVLKALSIHMTWRLTYP